MRYYKMIVNGYIIAVGVGSGGNEITKSEYLSLTEIIKNKPIHTQGDDYRLTESLEWEHIEVPVIEESLDDEITADEALSIILAKAFEDSLSKNVEH